MEKPITNNKEKKVLTSTPVLDKSWLKTLSNTLFVFGIEKKANACKGKDLYTFYYPGFNLRSTDLQAFIGIQQLDKIEKNCVLRQWNYELYQNFIKNDYWKITDFENCKISNFAYPIIHSNIKQIAKALDEGGVDCRPLVCGSIGNQPYWINIYGKQSFEFADIVDRFIALS